jgi:hypothetical protein
MTNKEAIERLEYIKTHHTDPEDYEDDPQEYTEYISELKNYITQLLQIA